MHINHRYMLSCPEHGVITGNRKGLAGHSLNGHCSATSLTPCRGDSLCQFPHLVKKPPAFYGTWELAPPTQQPATYLDPQPDQSNPHLLGLYLLSYSMEQSPSWEANRLLACQETTHILWKRKVHHHIHKCPPPVPILSQLDLTHTYTSHFLKILILSSHLCPGLPGGLFLSGFPPIPCIRPFSQSDPLHAPPISVFSMFREEYRSLSSSLCPSMLLLHITLHYTPTYSYVFQMVSFLRDSQTTSCIQFSFPSCVLYALPTSLSLIWSAINLWGYKKWSASLCSLIQSVVIQFDPICRYAVWSNLSLCSLIQSVIM
jgi:hypothetical protein